MTITIIIVFGVAVLLYISHAESGFEKSKLSHSAFDLNYLKVLYEFARLSHNNISNNEEQVRLLIGIDKYSILVYDT